MGGTPESSASMSTLRKKRAVSCSAAAACGAATAVRNSHRGLTSGMWELSAFRSYE